jgi:hypothetical protein
VDLDNWEATSDIEDFVFDNVVFDNCGAFDIKQSDLGNAFGFKGFIFDSCTFKSTTLNMKACDSFEFRTCNFNLSGSDLDKCSNFVFDKCKFLDSGQMKLSTNYTTTTIDNIFLLNCKSNNTAFRADSVNNWFIQGCDFVNTNIYSQYTSLKLLSNNITQEDGYNFYASQQSNSSTGGLVVLFFPLSVSINNNKIINYNANIFDYAAITGSGSSTKKATFEDNYIAGFGHGISFDDNYGEAGIQLSVVKNNTIILSKPTNRSNGFGYCCDSNSFTQISDNSMFAEPNSGGVIRMKSFSGNVKNLAVISNNIMYKTNNSGAVLSPYSNWSGVISNNIYNCNNIIDENTIPSVNEFRIFERNINVLSVITLPTY